MPCLHTLPDGSLLLKLRVQPKASRNEIAGMLNDALKIRLTTPPVEGRANKAAIALLAKRLHLPKSAFTIKSGLQNRNKEIRITGCTEKGARHLLLGESSEDTL